MRRDNGTGPARPLGRESDATLNFGLLGNPRCGQDHALAIGTTTLLAQMRIDDLHSLRAGAVTFFRTHRVYSFKLHILFERRLSNQKW
jgi:hypothetical protein